MQAPLPRFRACTLSHKVEDTQQEGMHVPQPPATSILHRDPPKHEPFLTFNLVVATLSVRFWMGKQHNKRKRSTTTVPESNKEDIRSREADVVVDGSFGEGGGQVVRASAALAAVLGRSLRVENVRASRPRPGLAAQHVAGLLGVAHISGSRVFGAIQNSTDFYLSRSDETYQSSGSTGPDVPLIIDAHTAGACALLLQAVLPVVLCRLPVGHALVLKGGTFGLAAPHADYIQHVLSRNLRHFGIDLSYKVEQHGFFPKGGAVVHVKVGADERSAGNSSGSPLRALAPVDLTFSREVRSVAGRVIVVGDVDDRIGEEMLSAAKSNLRKNLRSSLNFAGAININLERLTAAGPRTRCAAITLWATLGSIETNRQEKETVVGASGILQNDNSTPSEIAERAADELCEIVASGACVDPHMADQLPM